MCLLSAAKVCGCKWKGVCAALSIRYTIRFVVKRRPKKKRTNTGSYIATRHLISTHVFLSPSVRFLYISLHLYSLYKLCICCCPIRWLSYVYTVRPCLFHARPLLLCVCLSFLLPHSSLFITIFLSCQSLSPGQSLIRLRPSYAPAVHFVVITDSIPFGFDFFLLEPE